MDITPAIIVAAMSVASLIAGYRAGDKNRHGNHRRELKKIGRLLGVRRRHRESDQEYTDRLMQAMQGAGEL